MSINLPPRTENEEGEKRTVGFELEFAGLEITRTAEIIQEAYGGEIIEDNRYEYRIIDTELGEFRVELDARILQKMASKNFLENIGLDIDTGKFTDSLEDALDTMAKSVIPIEIVMPPVELNDMDRLEKLQVQLQKNKAEGTKTSIIHAFGMHLNIESPDLKAETLLAYLRSFMLLYPWLLEKLNIDITRRISPFVDSFPDAYVNKILEPDYKPDLETLIDDYLIFNDTRNRPLDMMPIFGLLDQERISKVLGGEKNNPRPTFHYRLPNSRIDEPDWKFSGEWNDWCEVEKLAADKDMLNKLSRLYLVRRSKTLVSFKKEWAETISILLDLEVTS
ncbi:amidoligase [Balneolaceae bacterium YR4-1]|uniref:Amidoligase n=1 Tax=Halalkalibaculum roseum TaxID=2709311 RepID=A0A6M1T6X4_9BACT|nr:amidoligase family protein [Halalkalibaculum roseum]NGP76023.1 amidoligase [Halalkalibaculum roseum]